MKDLTSTDENEKLLASEIQKDNERAGKKQFFISVFGVFACYLIYGYFQELIFKLEGMSGWYLTLIQFFYYIIFGLISNRQDIHSRKIPLRIYMLIAFLTLGTMSMSNSSLEYLNYPTEVIFKCCKLIPVLIGGIIIQKKKFSVLDVLAAVCMSIGLIFFTLADSKVQPNFNILGVLMISTALLFDAIIGNVQEKFIKQYEAPTSEVVLYSYGIGFFYLFFAMILTGNLGRAFEFCSNHPVKTYGYAFFFSLSGYIGVQFVLTLIKNQGALIAVTVTTARKAVTIILSFIIFAKPFTFNYVWSGMIVVLGIYLNVLSKFPNVSLASISHSVLDFFVKMFSSKNKSSEIVNI